MMMTVSHLLLIVA